MITNQAQKSMHNIFLKAAHSRLVLDPSDICKIDLLDSSHASEINNKRIVALTISSISFKIFLMLHIDDDLSTRSYYLKEAPNKDLDEYLSEITNLLCGAVNQELSRYFPVIGMSTPYLLRGLCVSFLNDLKHEHLLRYSITISGSVHLFATVCICANAPMDFEHRESDIEEVAGELELF